MNKTYEITIYIPDFAIENVKYCLEEAETEEDKKYWEEALTFLIPLQDTTIQISTLEEYFSLLTKFSDYFDGQYEIFNCGQYITLAE